jgi:hypothetical protein
MLSRQLETTPQADCPWCLKNEELVFSLFSRPPNRTNLSDSAAQGSLAADNFLQKQQ